MNRLIRLCPVAAALILTPAASADISLPPAPAEEKVAASNSPAWLGVWTEPLPDLVSQHLGLPKGSGLAIQEIVEDSPAKAAGLQTDDVVIRVGDQTIWNPQQFTALIRSHKPGDRVDLHVLRAEEPLVLTPTLGERPAGFVGRGGGIGRRDMPWARPAIPEDDPLAPMDQVFRDMIENRDNPLARVFENPALPEDVAALLEQQLRDPGGIMKNLQIQMEQVQPGRPVPGAMNIRIGMNAQVQINDVNGGISIKKENGKTTLRATDPEGNLLFEGPFDTDEEKAMVPPGIRERAGRLIIQNHFMEGLLQNQDAAPAGEAPAPDEE